ncbi:hypothetical protein F5I97DRAFT_2075887 [Phlebopus sp. FC_14]|nr:hypothetical protein F5I97DRAFT_2075887 [Phlebopus sp. FC_14]
MPCYSTETASHFATLTPVKPGFCIRELLGNAEGENPATFNIFRIDKGPPLSHDKGPFHMFGTVTEGELVLEDFRKQETVHVKAGDIFRVAQGTPLRWSSPEGCKGTCIHLKPPGDQEYLNGIY